MNILLGVFLILASAASVNAQETAAPANPQAIIHTSMGDIRLELFAAAAPVTVGNFIQYAQSGFYDNTVFHRVISHFMIQGGGMTADLKEKPTQEPIVNEATNRLSNGRGTIAMARTPDPHSATSQFFINVQDNITLNHTGTDNPGAWGYAVFGHVIDGIDVVDEIRFVETHAVPPHGNVPKTPVIITSVEVIPASGG